MSTKQENKSLFHFSNDFIVVFHDEEITYCNMVQKNKGIVAIMNLMKTLCY